MRKFICILLLVVLNFNCHLTKIVSTQTVVTTVQHVQHKVRGLITIVYIDEYYFYELKGNVDIKKNEKIRLIYRNEVPFKIMDCEGYYYKILE